MKNVLLLVLLLLLSVGAIIAGCSSATPAAAAVEQVVPQNTTMKVCNERGECVDNVFEMSNGCKIYDFGHGVLFFHCAFQYWAPAMSEYIATHPGVKICAVDGPSGEWATQWAWGTWVIVDNC